MGKSHIYIWGAPIADYLQVMDFHDPSSARYPFPKNSQSGSIICNTVLAGGAALLTDLIEQLVPKDCADVFGTRLDVRTAKEGGSQRQRPVADEKDSFNYKTLESVPKRWTVCHAYRSSIRGGKRKYGDGPYRQTGWSDVSFENWVPEELVLKRRSDSQETLLVIDDRGRFFPKDLCKSVFKECSNDVASQADHIIIKSARPHTSGERDQWTPLCTYLRDVCPDLAKKTTVLISLQGLRSLGLPIGMSISWEQLFEQVLSALENRQSGFLVPETKELAFDRVIVTLGLSGAVSVTRNGERALVFDPTCQEGDYENRYRGVMDGYNTCVTSALVTAWAESSPYKSEDETVSATKVLDFPKATRIGLEMARLLHRNGYDPAIIEKGEKDDNNKYVLTFPYEKLEDQYYRYWQPITSSFIGPLADTLLNNPPKSLKSVKKRPFRDSRLAIYRNQNEPGKDLSFDSPLSILQDHFWRQHLDDGDPSIEPLSRREGRLITLACRIAQKGPTEALRAIPVENVGLWYSADRSEIEGVRNVKNAIHDYLDNPKETRPLSIAVFGPPGAGKSFAIKELAKDKVIQRHRLDILTFNLAQFKDATDLTKAFHQVRESTLRGMTPLAFWDEFDSSSGSTQLGWLKYFLSPLQDGQFTDADGIHRIGRGVHVFAGSSVDTFEDFTRKVVKPEVKKKDFISRMSAFLNVKGINPVVAEPGTIQENQLDFMFVIRRAVLLNGLLRAHNDDSRGVTGVNIDPGILCALLLVPAYRYGARSMEAIVKAGLQPRKSRLQAGCIPAAAQLAMHVDAEKFIMLASFRDDQELIDLYEKKDERLKSLLGQGDAGLGYLNEVLNDQERLTAAPKGQEEQAALQASASVTTGSSVESSHVLGYLTRDDFPGILHAISTSLFAKGNGFNFESVSVSSVPNCGGVYLICKRISGAQKQFFNTKRCRSWLKWAAWETLRTKYEERYEQTYLKLNRYAPRHPRFHVHVAIHEDLSSKYVYVEFLAPDQPGIVNSVTEKLADNEWNIVELSLRPAGRRRLKGSSWGKEYLDKLNEINADPKLAHFCAWLLTETSVGSSAEPKDGEQAVIDAPTQAVLRDDVVRKLKAAAQAVIDAPTQAVLRDDVVRKLIDAAEAVIGDPPEAELQDTEGRKLIEAAEAVISDTTVLYGHTESQVKLRVVPGRSVVWPFDK